MPNLKKLYCNGIRSLTNIPSSIYINTDDEYYYIEDTNVPQYEVINNHLVETKQGEIYNLLRNNDHIISSREFKDPFSILKEMLY